MSEITCPQCMIQHYVVLDTDVDNSYTVKDFSFEEKFCSCECMDKYEECETYISMEDIRQIAMRDG